MTAQQELSQFFRTTMRHFAELRGSAPASSARGVNFPKDWFDLPDAFLADFGAVFFLASLTSFHRRRTLADLFASFEAPLRLGQYKLFRSNGFARAGITWAGLTPEAERRFAVDHQALEAQDWNGGTSVWLVDFLAPFGHVDQMIPLLTHNPDLTRLRTLWHNKDGSRYRIVEWSRPRPDAEIRVKSYGVGQFRRMLDGGGAQMAAPNITGTIAGAVLEDSGVIVTGALTDSANFFANTWSINSGAAFGAVSINAAGVWSYDLDDLNATVKALGAGDTLTDTFVVRVSDLAGTDLQTITITITGVPCFTAGTMIETAAGPRDCADLMPGDKVWTRDHDLQPLRWIGRRAICARQLAMNDKLCPVRIAAGALGAGLPIRDLLVSRQHRMMVSSDIAMQICGAHEVLLPAIRLVGLPGITLETGAQSVEYVHLLFDRHQIVFAEGAPSESLLLGPEAMRMLPDEARQEIGTLFPKAAQRISLFMPARLIPQRHRQKFLVARSRTEALLPQGFEPGSVNTGRSVAPGITIEVI